MWWTYGHNKMPLLKIVHYLVQIWDYFKRFSDPQGSKTYKRIFTHKREYIAQITMFESIPERSKHAVNWWHRGKVLEYKVDLFTRSRPMIMLAVTYLTEELTYLSDLFQCRQHPLVILELVHKATDPMQLLGISVLVTKTSKFSDESYTQLVLCLLLLEQPL